MWSNSLKPKILIIGLNWLGDSIMSMPAIEAIRQELPDSNITLAVKEKLVDLWKLFAPVDDIIKIQGGADGTMKTAKVIRAQGFDRAYIFPNSFRSALLAFAGGVPRRIGMAGHTRSAMLTEVSKPTSEGKGNRHQSWEYIDILGIQPDAYPWLPTLNIPDESDEKVREWLDADRSINIALVPGAAFGDAKRWPAENFCEVGRKAAAEHNAKVFVLGAPSEAAICDEIAAEIGLGAMSVAGKTSLADMAALLRLCSYAVSNDCGGMHMAAAMGVKTVSIFGLTDPTKTGPLGDGHRLVLAEGCSRSRDLSKGSSEARTRLASISPDRVYIELQSLLSQEGGKT